MRCVVIGAGIVGVSTAIWLQRAGFEVTLLDRDGPASGTSFGNAGVLAATAATPVTVPGLWKKAPGMLLFPNAPLFLQWSYLPKLAPFLTQFLRHCTAQSVEHYAHAMGHLVADSLEQHQALAKGTSAEKFIKDVSYCFGYENETSFNADAKYRKFSKEIGYKYDVVTGEEHAKDDQFFGDRLSHIVKWANCGMISDPGAYVTALVNHFVENGGTLEIATLIDFKYEKAGISALITDKGELDADRYLFTTGIWSADLMKKLGLNVPMESERGYHIELHNPDRAPQSPMMMADQKFVFTPMDGRIRCAGLVEFANLNAPASSGPIKMLKHHVARLFPDLTYSHVSEWMGHRPSTTDSLPLIGSLSKYKNVVVGFGHQHLGLTAGPKTGRLIADTLAGNTPNVDLAPYSPDRF